MSLCLLVTKPYWRATLKDQTKTTATETYKKRCVEYNTDAYITDLPGQCTLS